MGLDNQIYTILNAGWVTATIAKPVFHLNPDEPNEQTRNLFIQSNFEGTLTPTNNDNSTDERETQFELTGYEGNEEDSIKAMTIIKTLLHRYDLSKGHYHIDRFRIIEENQIRGYVLQGHQFQSIEDDEFL